MRTIWILPGWLGLLIGPSPSGSHLNSTFDSLKGSVRVAYVAIVTMHRRARERRQLAELDRRLLDDIGIRPEEVYREVSKRCWEA